ncbi:MAG: hypothetical protein RIR90_1203, partial [Bacteroidota bacterium]
NSGFVSVIIFIVGIVFAWFSGIITALRRKPNLSIRVINKATFYSIWDTDEYENKTNNRLRKLAIAIYIRIANVGEKDTSIDKITVSYKIQETKLLFFKRTMILSQWHLLNNITFGLEDKAIILRTLRQTDLVFGDNHNVDYLSVGKSLTGVAYFEQDKFWGSYEPIIEKDLTIRVKLKVKDVYSRVYIKHVDIPFKEIHEAQELSATFGKVKDLENDS